MAASPCKEEMKTCICSKQHQTVMVESRTSPGINKPGGAGRILCWNPDGSVDVKYVLGGVEKGVALCYVQCLVEDATPRARRRPANFQAEMAQLDEAKDSSHKKKRRPANNNKNKSSSSSKSKTSGAGSAPRRAPAAGKENQPLVVPNNAGYVASGTSVGASPSCGWDLKSSTGEEAPAKPQQAFGISVYASSPSPQKLQTSPPPPSTRSESPCVDPKLEEAVCESIAHLFRVNSGECSVLELLDQVRSHCGLDTTEPNIRDALQKLDSSNRVMFVADTVYNIF
mmetsp:Transcript_21860/g.31731  ORF Transcript_21860/g.31731 Transcript_21860/m.31731 type:complete len:284 (-) Transcript_21860:86-937(-)